MLRARAIECQSYVVAAAQVGKHNSKRSSYGHSMIVDPWGKVIAKIEEGEGVASANLDLAKISKIRQEMPVREHRRPDLYGLVTLNNCAVLSQNESNSDGFQFGPHHIPCNHVVSTILLIRIGVVQMYEEVLCFCRYSHQNTPTSW